MSFRRQSMGLRCLLAEFMPDKLATFPTENASRTVTITMDARSGFGCAGSVDCQTWRGPKNQLVATEYIRVEEGK